MNTPASAAPPSPAATTLAEAARVLAAVAFEGRSADAALARMSTSMPAAQRPAVRAVALGSLRWYWRLTAIAATLLAGKPLVPALRALLLVALHQLEYSRNAPELTVSAAVDAARLLLQPRATGLVNALLRRFLRERSELLQRALQEPATAGAHPDWLLQALRAAWPAQWPRIIQANNEHPPMSLRVDLSRVSIAGYQAQLAARGQQAQPLPWLPTALVLGQPVGVSELPGFDDGRVSVQDAGAQLACALLGVQRGERVLDACAAPGGKTGALLEAVDGELQLTAVDIDGARVGRIADNLRRLKRQARLVTADLAQGPGGLTQSSEGWSAAKFDRILVDAPCSATGVIRRHPDIKLLRRPEDVAALVATQRRILLRCLNLLRPGGTLVYSTCSVLPAENEGVVEALMAADPRIRTLPWPPAVDVPPELLSCPVGMQLLPGNAAQTDGFYYACLTVT